MKPARHPMRTRHRPPVEAGRGTPRWAWAGGAVGLLLLGLAGTGCTSRTLPLPPPDVEPLAGVDVQGQLLVRGTAKETAWVAVINESTGFGTVVHIDQEGCNSSCPFEVQLPASAGDDIAAWQFFETSDRFFGTVPEAP
ncbi:MAG: hypothetical protein OEZ06_22415 [Myxococcales bacterium]|nr:hypothetical protein [Myxococcales bacterium]